MSSAEIESFQGLWAGGYHEGDPMDPYGTSGYSAFDERNGYANQSKIRADQGIRAGQIGYISTLYATYLTCIRDRVAGKVVLEIGPGRGTWTAPILLSGAKYVYALDALSAEHNRFYEHLSSKGIAADRAAYIQVSDMECAGVPERSIDFFFSFGCLCHLSRDSVKTYFGNVFKKMKPSAEGFAMISDYQKMADVLCVAVDLNENNTPSPGRWYNQGRDWFCNMLRDFGYEIIAEDMGHNMRDPIVHFRKSGDEAIVNPMNNVATNHSAFQALQQARRNSPDIEGRAFVLSCIAALRLNGEAAEVGTYTGLFSEVLLNQTEVSKLYSVDPYLSYDNFRDTINTLDLEAIFQAARERLAPFGARSAFIRYFSEEAASNFADASLDFVYIDANHQAEYVKKDLEVWWPKVRPGGLLIGDDAFDVNDSQRNHLGDVTIVHARHPDGSPQIQGDYGVFHALRRFAAERGLIYLLSASQYIIPK